MLPAPRLRLTPLLGHVADQKIKATSAELEKLRAQLVVERRRRDNKQQYESMARVINQRPARDVTTA